MRDSIFQEYATSYELNLSRFEIIAVDPNKVIFLAKGITRNKIL
jgi:hypothetical protein